MRIAVVGTGYVGLVSAVCLADLGHEVTCVDLDRDRVAAVNAGRAPIHEAGLPELLTSVVASGRLTATTDVQEAVAGARLSLLAVGTPFDGSAIDVRQVRAAAEDVGRALAGRDDHHAVVVKSTVVPGTTEDVVAPAVAAASGRALGEGFGVAMNPEFLREGSAVEDFSNPDRIVYGASDAATMAVLDELYAVFPDTDRVRTTPRTAEMIKYAANSLLATLISFSNEIGNLSAAVGVDVTDVLAGVHLDRRLSPLLDDGTRVRPGITTYLEAGAGFGGSCFPKDVQALVAHGKAAGQDMSILEAVLEVNAHQPTRLVELVRTHLGDLAGQRVAVLGLAFKPGTDDVRESPALPVVTALADAGADVVAWDPVAVDNARDALSRPDVAWTDDLATALQGAAAAVIVTRWPQLEALPDLLGPAADRVLVVDGRRMLAPTSVPRYVGIGLDDRHVDPEEQP